MMVSRKTIANILVFATLFLLLVFFTGHAVGQPTVTFIPTTLAPGCIAVDSVRNRIFVAQNDSRGIDGFEVVVIDGATNNILATIPISGEPSYSGIAVNEVTGRVYVKTYIHLVVIDAVNLEVCSTRTLPSGGGPVVVNPHTNLIYASTGLAVYVIDGVSEDVVDRVWLSLLAEGMVIDTTRNHIYVAHNGPGVFTVIDGADNTIIARPSASRSYLAMAVDTALGQLYFADRKVSSPAINVLDDQDYSTLATLPIDDRCNGIAVNPETHRVYTGTTGMNMRLTIIDGVTRNIMDTISTYPHLTGEGCVNPATHRIYFACPAMEPMGGVVVVQDNKPPVAICKNVTVSAGDNCMAHESIDGGSYDPDGDPITLSQSPEGPYPLGCTPVTLTVTDDQNASSTCTALVTVVDDTPPVITGVSVTPSILWPPNHKMVAVTVNYEVKDNCDPGAAIYSILSVSSSEPEKTIRNGDKDPDWEIVDAHHVMLRAERSGTGNGRIYTITVTCTDTHGNSSNKQVTVYVPKNRNH